MSISAEYAQEYRKDPAVLCCRTEAGTVLTEHNLEDPAIFDELVESGLLTLTGALAIGQVMGATLVKTADSLTRRYGEGCRGHQREKGRNVHPGDENNRGCSSSSYKEGRCAEVAH